MAGKRHSLSIFELMSSQGATGASTGVSTDDVNNGVLSVVGYDQVAVQLGGGGSTYAATVNFQVTVDGSNWLDAMAINKSDGTQGDSVANDSGIWVIPITGMSGFRLNLSAWTDGNISGNARATVGGGNLSVADIDITSTSLAAIDSDVQAHMYAADTAAAAVPLAADTASPTGNALYVSPSDDSDGMLAHLGGDTVILPADAIADPTLLAQGLSFAMYYNGTTWDRAVGDTVSGLLVSQAGDTVILPADAIAAPALLPPNLNFPMVFNGTTWDRMVGSSSGLAVYNEGPGQWSADSISMALSTGIVMTQTVIFGVDDSGAGQRYKTLRGDSDGVAFASSDAAETLATVSLNYGHDGTNYRQLQVDSAARMKVTETWNSTMQESSADAINATINTVSSGEDWHIMWAWVEYLSDANAGNRQIVMQVRDSGDSLVMEIIPGVTQAASLTYKYMFAPGLSDMTAVRDTDYIMTPIPPTLIIPEFYDINIYDQADISSAAGEGMRVNLMVQNRARVST